MRLLDLLGPAVARGHAARLHELPDTLCYGGDAAAGLAAALARGSGRRAALCGDRRTLAAAGASTARALAAAGFTVATVEIPDGPDGASPRCDDVTRAALGAGLPSADVLVAVGSGVVNDLTKWLAADHALPYAVMATAPSMNGYAAANVATTVAGLKSLHHARAPRVIAADPAVLAAAPARLRAAGLGDVVARWVSTADWVVNHLLFGEHLDPALAGILDDLEPRYLDEPAALRRGEATAIRALFEALILSGCAMTLHGSSLPASGGEHLVSHTLDMLADVDGVTHDLHGRQVGVATILAAAIYQELVAAAPRFSPAGPPFDAARWGRLAPAVEVEHRRKAERLEATCAALRARWPELCAALRPRLRPPEAIKSALAAAGAAHRLADLGCTRDRFLDALLHCAAMRARFTSIDLAWAAGLLPGRAAALVDAWLT
jgi:glycerol-1-phosphate dehydrogenase [NAD(P)+]